MLVVVVLTIDSSVCVADALVVSVFTVGSASGSGSSIGDGTTVSLVTSSMS